MDRGKERAVISPALEGVVQSTLTRKDFLKVAGTGAAGAALLGTWALSSGCSSQLGRNTNVVLIILDTLRKDHVGAYGNDWIKTPNLDALANESLRFTRAYPESLPTICARRAIHTGIRTWPFRDWQLYKGVDIGLWGWQPIPENQTTLSEILQDNGYETLFVTDNLQQYDATMNYQRGFDAFDFIRGQTTDPYRPIWTYPPEKVRQALVRDEPLGPGSELYFRQYFANTAYRNTEEDWFAPRVFTRASEFLEVAREDRPFFLAVDAYDPHPPWDPPEEYVSLYDDGYDGPEPYTPAEGNSDNFTRRQLGRMGTLYSGEITMADRWLGNFLDKMDELNLFESTLLVVISDHGIAHGEHGIVGKPPSALWPEVEMIAEAGLAGLAMTPSHAWVAPAGGTRPALGTNPIAFAWPRPEGHPYVFDFATSAIARGDISLHEIAGKPIPEGWGIDSEGRPTTSASEALSGAMLTFGGHKGSALSTMIELMAGPLIGDMTSLQSIDFDEGAKAAPCHGELVLAFCPKRMGLDPEASSQAAEALFATIAGQGARLPSQRRFEARARSLKEGVRVPKALMDRIDALDL
jgi:arylsulfatase A-like enzyme